MSNRQGSLMWHRGECGHQFVVYSLEPTPPCCPDCTNRSRAALAHIVRDLGQVISRIDCEGLPSDDDDLDEWLRGEGLDEERLRNDIHSLASIIDEAREKLDEAERTGRTMLAKYPKMAERLEMPQ